MSESNDENTITENTTTESSTTENTTAENENNTENNTENNSENILNIIFSETNVTIVLWFLAIYIVISVALGIFDGSKDMNQLSTFVKTVDFAILLIVVGYCLYSYYSLSKEERSEIGSVSTSGLKDFLNDGYSIVYTGIFVAVLYGISYLMKLPMTTSEMPSSLGFLINAGFTVLILLIIIAVLTNFANIPIVDLIYDGIASLFSVTKEVVEEDGEITPIIKDEVFNVSNNLYTYEEAPYVCKALGATLADYDQIEQAYNNGAEWCNYGWSKDQLALFPTQKETWKKLYESTETQSCDKDAAKYKNMCGRPGINGGYIMNPNVKFGVNCYGIKPKAEQSDLDMMNANKDKVLPKSRHQMQTDRKMEFWKENSDKLLTINSFNRDSWSRF